MSCTGITIPCLQIEHQISGLRHRHTRSGADHYGCDDGGAIPNVAGGEDPRAWDTTVKAVLVTLESRMREILGPDEELQRLRKSLISCLPKVDFGLKC